MDTNGLVAGYFEDPLLGQTACVILKGQSDLTDGIGLLRFALGEYSEAQVVMVRLPNYGDKLAGFDDYLYYVSRSDEPHEVDLDASAIVVSPATRADQGCVADMLGEAFSAALVAQHRHADADRIRAQAASVLEAEGTVTFVAKLHGTTIGHATLLTGQTDELTGEAFIEMLDLLTRPSHAFARQAEAALVAASQQLAWSLSQKLIGHIVVEDGGRGYEAELLARLLSAGWRFDHKFVIADALHAV